MGPVRPGLSRARSTGRSSTRPRTATRATSRAIGCSWSAPATRVVTLPSTPRNPAVTPTSRSAWARLPAQDAVRTAALGAAAARSPPDPPPRAGDARRSSTSSLGAPEHYGLPAPADAQPASQPPGRQRSAPALHPPRPLPRRCRASSASTAATVHFTDGTEREVRHRSSSRRASSSPCRSSIRAAAVGRRGPVARGRHALPGRLERLYFVGLAAPRGPQLPVYSAQARLIAKFLPAKPTRSLPRRLRRRGSTSRDTNRSATWTARTGASTACCAAPLRRSRRVPSRPPPPGGPPISARRQGPPSRSSRAAPAARARRTVGGSPRKAPRVPPRRCPPRWGRGARPRPARGRPQRRRFLRLDVAVAGGVGRRGRRRRDPLRPASTCSSTTPGSSGSRRSPKRPTTAGGRTITVNATGVFYGMRAAIPALLPRRRRLDHQHRVDLRPGRRAGLRGLHRQQGRGDRDDQGRRARARPPTASASTPSARAPCARP